MQPLNDEIVRLNNAFKLKFKKLYLGVSNVRCKSCYPYPRLIYSLGNDGNTFFSDGISETVFERGTWVLIPPFVETRQHLRHSHHLAIHFTCSLLDGMELFSGMKQIEHGYAPELLPVAEAITPENSIHFLNGANLILRHALYFLMQKHDWDLERKVAAMSIYYPLTEYLHRKLDLHISVGEMAKVMNSGEQSFARKFSASLGMTPHKFNENIIIDHAVELLDNSDLSIKEIAAKLHFTNEYYFSRFFKRHMKISPGNFRNKPDKF